MAKDFMTPNEMLTLCDEAIRRQVPMKGIVHGKFSHGKIHRDKLMITAVLPDGMKNTPDSIEYYFNGKLDTKITAGGLIEPVFYVESFSTEQVILERTTPRRDAQEVLMRRLTKERKPRVAILLARLSEARYDVRAAIGDKWQRYYRLDEIAVNMLKADEIITKIKDLDRSGNYDLIAVVRGGGETINVFDHQQIAVTIRDSETPVATAIGHKLDRTLSDDMADASFATPWDFGFALREVAEKFSKNPKIEGVERLSSSEPRRQSLSPLLLGATIVLVVALALVSLPAYAQWLGVGDLTQCGDLRSTIVSIVLPVEDCDTSTVEQNESVHQQAR